VSMRRGSVVSSAAWMSVRPGRGGVASGGGGRAVRPARRGGGLSRTKSSAVDTTRPGSAPLLAEDGHPSGIGEPREHVRRGEPGPPAGEEALELPRSATSSTNRSAIEMRPSTLDHNAFSSTVDAIAAPRGSRRGRLRAGPDRRGAAPARTPAGETWPAYTPAVGRAPWRGLPHQLVSTAPIRYCP